MTALLERALREVSRLPEEEHDIGLPMTEALPATVTKGNLPDRQIVLQVFQRTILTYDPVNPADFQVERANVGVDYRRTFPDRVPG